ncbi:MAG: FHA domain-containing protein [Prevotellaceae bacterium]|jgi:pSer/pThr/pTyr-binding forkhead associated (FHA) protein|nr:FHA domain-containing protein [Prevotellaceae bacterium]
MSGFTKCPSGHYYSEGLASCPYCSSGSNTSSATKIMGGDSKTKVIGGFGGGENTTNPTIPYPDNEPPKSIGKGTVIWHETEEKDTNTEKEKAVQQIRNTRRLVGWLVSYTIDKMGVDYKLYEGNNLIGRDVDCNITVDDELMSGKHAILLFRALDGYVLQDGADKLSSNGTFVNEESIGFEKRILNDGDIIRVGQTVFKFRTSL